MVLVWILAAFVAYWMAVVILDTTGYLERINASASGPLLMFRTVRGKVLLNRLAKPKRFWRAYGNVGIALAGLIMVIAFVFLLRVAHLSIFQTPEPSPITEPQNVLVIPGVNDFLPLSMAPEILLGLLIGIVVHEFGHGILCRAADIDVSSMGAVMLAVIPFGAFVEPDEEDVEDASSGDRTRMYSAGVMNNFVLTVVAFLLLVGSLGAIQPHDGVGVQNVVDDSLATDAGVQQGDVVTAVNGEPVEGNEEFLELTESAQGEVTFTLLRDGETSEVTLPFDVSGVEITRVSEGTAAAGAGIQDGDVITSINGNSVENTEEFRERMDGFSPGEEITVEVDRDGETVVLDVTLGEHPQRDGAFLGVSYLTTSERVGVVPYDIQGTYDLLASTDPTDWLLSIYLPLGTLIGLSPFFGFDGFILNFYEVTGVASNLGWAYWIIPNVLYWTAWVNFNLSIFNCIPALPLDGGHILTEGFKSALDPFTGGEEVRDKLASSLSAAIAVAMFGSMVLMIVAPRVL